MRRAARAVAGLVGYANDHEMLGHGMRMYDAYNAWLKQARGETHNWNPVTFVV